MIREERDPAFWSAVADHPSVQPTCKVEPAAWAHIVGKPDVRPYASENGGHIFAALDAIGRTWELHSVFRPEAWGREVNAALKACLRALGPWDLIVVHEVRGWWRSRPPVSYGFRQAGGFHGSPIGELRTWILARAAWEASPVRRRLG